MNPVLSAFASWILGKFLNFSSSLTYKYNIFKASILNMSLIFKIIACCDFSDIDVTLRIESKMEEQGEDRLERMLM